jgi:hypothetical protein
MAGWVLSNRSKLGLRGTKLAPDGIENLEFWVGFRVGLGCPKEGFWAVLKWPKLEK